MLVDLEGRSTLADDQVLSKAGWTPYAGRELRGAVVTTLLRGVPVAEHGAPVAEPGTGAHVAPRPADPAFRPARARPPLNPRARRPT